MTDSTAAPLLAPAETAKTLGRRVNGHKWIQPKKAFRPAKGLTSYEKRNQKRFEMIAVKAKEKELKEEKEQEQRERIAKIKERRKVKAERERLAVLEAKMHKKRAERLKRKEKRNKLLHS